MLIEVLAAAAATLKKVFLELGDPWDPNVFQGPAISETQRQKVLRLIKSGIDSGATLMRTGTVTVNGGSYFGLPA
jgi:acyl-CoA reductase-like NAD-dependent aldehyde dehydrogenase